MTINKTRKFVIIIFVNLIKINKYQYRFSMGNGWREPAVNVNMCSNGVETGTSTNKYSTGRGRASRVTSFPYESFSCTKKKTSLAKIKIIIISKVRGKSQFSEENGDKFKLRYNLFN